jgi:hypothetical protein
LRGLIRDLHRVEGGELQRPYFGGAGMNPSRLRPGSGLGFGFGAFLASFLPLSLLPMVASVTQEGGSGEGLSIRLRWNETAQYTAAAKSRRDGARRA